MIAEAAYEGAKRALSDIGLRYEVHKDSLSTKEAIAFLDAKGVSMSEGHLKNLKYNGKIPAYTVNRKLRFLRRDLELWIERKINYDLQSMENAERILAKSAGRNKRKLRANCVQIKNQQVRLNILLADF